MSKETSIEWLARKLINAEPNVLEWHKYILQAKEMHKREIIDAHMSGYDSSGGGAEDYYDAIYKEYHSIDTNEMIELPNNYCDCETQTYYQWEMAENKCCKCNKKIYTEEQLQSLKQPK